MKRIESFLLKSCAYTVIVTLLLYIALLSLGVTDQGIPVLKFLLLFGYGVLIAAAEVLYNGLKIRKLFRIFIHYGLLLIGFIAVYSLSGITASITPMRVFVIIVLFTLLYCLVLGAVKLIAHLVKKADHAIESMPKTTEEPKPEYRSRFGGE